MSFSFKGKPDQRCKGQSSLYDHLLILGPLTDPKIEQYELEGKYGPDRQKAAVERRKLVEAQQKVREQKAKARVKTTEARAAMVKDLL